MKASSLNKDHWGKPWRKFNGLEAELVPVWIPTYQMESIKAVAGFMNLHESEVLYMSYSVNFNQFDGLGEDTLDFFEVEYDTKADAQKVMDNMKKLPNFKDFYYRYKVTKTKSGKWFLAKTHKTKEGRERVRRMEDFCRLK